MRISDWSSDVCSSDLVLADFAAAVFDKADVLHAPVVPMPVPTIAESDVSANPGFMDYVVRFGHCSRPFNYLGLPALSLPAGFRSEEHPSELQSLMRVSYAVFRLKEHRHTGTSSLH